ncbi:MmcQ/YjbR family DNA-binding protein [Mycolicibacter arupensis]|jgi:hypothetical protein|uniref:MmcQ/YjbR family DNA-binding protein n=1 Tax=Mycolicibacter arupensis TaxID=342002 RepID=A0A5C7XW44_9MYCO|nr:MmcQ/YjbR family DNA-binding protein [Mycolicibacter arupensis]TXI53204.1 MAG: hypothetical protein E6Q54_17015 [Mycolicibacter arupensis]
MADRPARTADVHEVAAAMPHVTRIEGPKGNPIYQVGGKSFVFFRTPRPDATDPVTGQAYPDVIVIWVESDSDKQALIQDPTTPFFTTDHFNGHLSVLVREADLHTISASELTEVIQDAWLSRASTRRRVAWLATRDADGSGR